MHIGLVIGSSQSSSISKWNGALAWIGFGLLFVSLVYRLGHLPLLAPDEGRNMQVAREMNVSGSWLVPTYNGLDRLDKPAFFYKTVGISMALFGENELAGRLPSAVAALALAGLVFLFARRGCGTATGLMAAIVAGTTPLFIANARTVILDMELAVFVCGAIFCGFIAETVDGKGRRNWYLLGSAAAGVATLIKGPVGFLIPLLVLLVFNRVEKRRGAWKRILAPLNVLIFFGITLPWFIGLCMVHPDFLRYGLLEESFKRFTSARTFHRSEPFYFYIPIVAVMFFPWSVLFPEGIWATWKKRWQTASVDRFCITWALVTLAFFSVSSSKLPGYILSVVAPSAILVARLFAAAMASPESLAARLINRGVRFLAIFCAVLAVGMLAAHSQAGLLRKPLRIPLEEAVGLGHAAFPLALAFFLLAAVSAAAWLRRNVRLAFLSLALLAPAGVAGGLGVFEIIYASKSFQQLAQSLKSVPAETDLACVRCMPPGLSFYLNRIPILISKDGRELTSNYQLYFLAKNPWPADKIVPFDQFGDWLGSRQKPVYLVAQKQDRMLLEKLAAARNLQVADLPQGFFGLALPATSKDELPRRP